MYFQLRGECRGPGSRSEDSGWFATDNACRAPLNLSVLKEATLRDFLQGAASAGQLALEARGAVEVLKRNRRRVHIEDLVGGQRLTITAPMLVRLCDAVLGGELPGPALETIGFAVIASAFLRWDDGDDLVSRVLYDWASPDITFELTPDNVRMFRDWLTGTVRPPSEPEITTDTLADWGSLSRTEKVRVQS